MKLKPCIAALLMLCVYGRLQAQNNFTITGTVLDAETHAAIGGAEIIDSTRNHTLLTNANGGFVLAGLSNGQYINVTCTGYLSKHVIINGQSNLVVLLTPSVNQLDETIVIAYGKTTRRMNTGAISRVTAAVLDKQPVSNPLAALAGRVPGLLISQQSGIAGSSFNATIRGQSALDLSLSRNDPLFVIDGVPFESGNQPSSQLTSAANNPVAISSGGISPLNSINPSDIESIEVLKDADATSIYGSRGANGVILITTKKGKVGHTEFSASYYTGYSRIAHRMPMLNTNQYVAMRREAFANDGLVPGSDPFDAGYAPDIMLWDTTRCTDFVHLLEGGTSRTNNADISVSGGTQQTNFLIGLHYHKETTVFSNDFADALASTHINIRHQSTDGRFHLQFSSIFGYDHNSLPVTDFTRYINLPPNLRLYNTDGTLAWQDSAVVYAYLGNGDITNPLALLQQHYLSINENLGSNLQADYLLWKGFKLSLSMGYNRLGVREKSQIPSVSIDPNTGALPSAAFANNYTGSWIAEPQLNYTLRKKRHELSILLGNTLQEKTTQQNAEYGTNYSSDLLLGSIAAAGDISANNNYTNYRYTAFFGRLHYSFADRYVINLSGRRDGSSRFGPGRQWANFGAAGAAWIFSAEKGLKKSMPWLSFGKLRASYGTTGNDQIGDYKYLNLWRNTSRPYDGVSGLYPANLYNPNYSWEINKKLEAAIELGFLKDQVMLSVDYYNNRCSNQLVGYSLPGQTGFFSVIKNFPGLVQNSGWEIVLTAKPAWKTVHWESNLTLTVPKNKLIAFPGLAQSSYAYQYAIGEPLSVIMGYKYLGVDPTTGLYSFEDVNKDGWISSDDYQVLGHTGPVYYAGWENNLTYKQWTFSIFFDGRKQTGVNYLNELSAYPPGWIYNQPALVSTRWQQPGDHAPVQRYTTGYTDAYTAIGNLAYSNGKYGDASFIRCRNIALTHNIPKRWLQYCHISNSSLYVEGQNLFTITKYKGSDPETQNLFVLPPLRTLVMGIRLTL